MPRVLLSARLLTLSAIGLLLLACRAPSAHAQVTLGVMGDSLSDEYANNGRPYAQNWVEQLATFDNVNLGANVSNLPPRFVGYNQNWALAGATSASVLSGGQATGLAAQIPNAGGYGIDYAVFMIGANDFSPNSAAYANIYNGAWTTTQINNYVSSVVGNISTALNDILPTGVKTVVATVPDYGITPAVQAAFPDASKRQLVANVIAQVNAGIKATAQADHIVVADLSAMIGATFGTEGNFRTTVSIGNVPINLTQSTSSTSSQAGFCADGIHPYTTLQGTLADLLVQALDTGYNAGIPLFSEAQILSHAGLTYGGSDTLAAQIGPYSNYVISYAGSPPIAGDTNHDNIVNSQDIALVSSNWLHIGSNLAGDVNGDGIVNIQDIALMSSNWLHTGPSAGNAAAVPEPATLGLALLTAGLLTMARRRKN
ncbi:MAG TPA: SGNH/GDSL hydrolase family protein [Pirellulales bacterium]|nr:SGNH/GDSL hydrolase family protein [Pirellulales bacterium]